MVFTPSSIQLTLSSSGPSLIIGPFAWWQRSKVAFSVSEYRMYSIQKAEKRAAGCASGMAERGERKRGKMNSLYTATRKSIVKAMAVSNETLILERITTSRIGYAEKCSGSLRNRDDEIVLEAQESCRYLWDTQSAKAARI